MDVFDYFGHSTKRKGELREFATFCNFECMNILAYFSFLGISLITGSTVIIESTFRHLFMQLLCATL